MQSGKKIYIVGIGGIGLSALAQLYKHAGAQVQGSDRAEQPTTKLLREKGIAFLSATTRGTCPKTPIYWSTATLSPSTILSARERASSAFLSRAILRRWAGWQIKKSYCGCWRAW